MRKMYEYFDKKTKRFKETTHKDIAKRDAHKGTLINTTTDTRLKFNPQTKRWNKQR